MRDLFKLAAQIPLNSSDCLLLASSENKNCSPLFSSTTSPTRSMKENLRSIWHFKMNNLTTWLRISILSNTTRFKQNHLLEIMGCTTKSTFGISRPRAATSVATSTLNCPSRKALRVLSLWNCCMFPCNALLPMILAMALESDSASFFVFVKIILLPPCAYLYNIK